jgi:hypothetical protein
MRWQFATETFISIMPPAARPAPPAAGAIERMILRPESQIFWAIFKDADLTAVQKVKQWINVVVYSCGKTVARMVRMDEGNLHIEMNKAYYSRLQVIFEDVTNNVSYWANHFGFDCTFAQMMTLTFGAASVAPTFFFDYGGNENLTASQIESAKPLWTSQHLWRKYGEMKTEMQGTMLPVLLKQRILSVNSGESYEFKTGGSVGEVFYAFLGAMFQVRHFLLMLLQQLQIVAAAIATISTIYCSSTPAD